MKSLFTLWALWLLAACQTSVGQSAQTSPTGSASPAADVPGTRTAESRPPAKGPTALRMEQMGLKNIAEADSTIAVRLMYARPDNFCGKTLYADLTEGYLHPDALNSLLRAQQLLRREQPRWRLVVYDAARPLAIQQLMWNTVAHTPKQIYVSNPKNGGGMHNYGLAVDVSLLDEKDDSVPMGTRVDYLGKASQVGFESTAEGRRFLTDEALRNRRLLRRVMKQAGFRVLNTEWWHFNRVSRAEARQNYPVIP